MTSCCGPSQPSRRVDNATARCDKKLDIKNSSGTRPSPPPPRPSSETVHSLFLAKGCTGDQKRKIFALLGLSACVCVMVGTGVGARKISCPMQCNCSHCALSSAQICLFLGQPPSLTCPLSTNNSSEFSYWKTLPLSLASFSQVLNWFTCPLP